MNSDDRQPYEPDFPDEVLDRGWERFGPGVIGFLGGRPNAEERRRRKLPAVEPPHGPGRPDDPRG